MYFIWFFFYVRVYLSEFPSAKTPNSLLPVKTS
jgi:hypothetical protein